MILRDLITPWRTGRAGNREGRVAKFIEQRTAKMPSDTFLWCALASIGASLAFKVGKKDGTANFIGQWAPTFLILGLYNKLVKVQGSDRGQGRRR